MSLDDTPRGYIGRNLKLRQGLSVDARDGGSTRNVAEGENLPSATGLSPTSGWLVVGAAVTGMIATYWDDAWHTEIGRDSTFIPPHLLLYGAMAVIGAVLAGWVLRVVVAGRSLGAVFATPGLTLTAVAGATVAGAAPVDAAWHAAFGRDAVLWSPPHLVSVIGTVCLVVGAFVGISAPRTAAVRVGLGVALLGGTQLVVLEYDTDVPQFSERLYLVLLLMTALAAGWVVRSAIGTRFDAGWVVGGYLLVRTGILVALSAAGWPAPDFPLPLVGLVVLNGPGRWGAARWPLAGLAMTGLQIVASATGVSSVSTESVTAAAAFVGPVLFAVLVGISVRRRGAAFAVAVAAILLAPIADAPLARAHDPGQGPERGSAELSVVGDGRGGLTVTVDSFSGLAPGIEPVRLVARRADYVVTANLHRASSAGAGWFTGHVVLPESGRWFVYVEVRERGRILETWVPVQQSMTVLMVTRRPVYVPAGTGPRPRVEYAVGAGLIGIGMGLMVWSALAVRRSRQAWTGSARR